VEVFDVMNVSGCWVRHVRNGHPDTYSHTDQGCFAATKDGKALLARWPDAYVQSDTYPSKIEVAVRSRVFAPHKRGLQYIVVQGFSIEHAANQWDANFWFPQNYRYAQSGALGTRSGYRWTIRNNTIRKAGTIGLDFGIEGGYTGHPVDNEGTNQPDPEIHGDHIVEHNVIEHNRASGVQGYGASGVFAYNVIQGNGGNGCAGAENAAFKSHGFVGSFEGNVFRGNTGGVPIWFDGASGEMRFSRNVVLVAEGESSDGVVFELGNGPIVVDNNVIVGSGMNSWNTPWTPHGKVRPGGTGIGVQDASNIIVAHNLVMNFTGGPAIDLHGMTGRKVDGKVASMSGWWIGANMLLTTEWCPWLHIHDKKTSGDDELIKNETVQRNLVTGGGLVPEGGAWYPADAGLDIAVGSNQNATGSAFVATVDLEQMVLTFEGDAVLDKTACKSDGPGGDVDFTGAKRSRSKCVPGPVDGLAPSKRRSVSLWPTGITPPLPPSPAPSPPAPSPTPTPAPPAPTPTPAPPTPTPTPPVPTHHCRITKTLGCYDSSNRFLPRALGSSSSMTHLFCAGLSRDHGFGDDTYCGVENGNQCWCGDSVAEGKKVDDAQCNKPCSGDAQETCGAGYRTDVFQAICDEMLSIGGMII